LDTASAPGSCVDNDLGNLGQAQLSAGRPWKFTEEQVCKAGIATTMARDPAIIEASGADTGVIVLSYKRPSDKETWVYGCEIKQNRIIWWSSGGRKRTHPDDDKITFEITGDQIHITNRFGDESAKEKTYSWEQLVD
jgi:hypothetical protein